MNNYGYRKQIDIITTIATDENYTIDLNLNTAGLIAAGKMNTNCSDLRIYDSNQLVELDRNVLGCNTGDTNISFIAKYGFSAGASDGNFYMYYDYDQAGAPPTEIKNIFVVGSDFDCGAANCDYPWVDDDDTPYSTWLGAGGIGNSGVMAAQGSGAADKPKLDDLNTTIPTKGRYMFAHSREELGDSYFYLRDSSNNNIVVVYMQLGDSPDYIQLCDGTSAGSGNCGGSYKSLGKQDISWDVNTFYNFKIDYNGDYVWLLVNDSNFGFGAIGTPTDVDNIQFYPWSDASPKPRLIDNVILYNRYPEISYSFDSEELPSSLSAFYTNTSPVNLDTENDINSTTIDLNNASTYSGASPTIFTWSINDVNHSYDENTTKTWTTPGTYYTCLLVVLDDSSDDTYCKNIHIKQYPWDVNFIWSPTAPLVYSTTDFNGSASDDENIASFTWNFGDGGSGSDANTTHTYTSGGVKNVCLTATDYDGLAKQLCKTMGIGGSLTLKFTDENTHAIITPNVIFNGIEYDVNSNGVIAFDLNGITTGTYQLNAWDINYSTRVWEWDLNSGSILDYNLVMLKDQIGQAQDINFLFYDENGENIIANKYVEIYIGSGNDKNYSGIRKTSSRGETSFYLNAADQNYTFVVDGNEYVPVKLNVLIPKDEITKANISPFDIDFWNIYTDTRTGLTASTTTYIFPNTYYCNNIDVNVADYYGRSYCIKLKGNPENYTLQPYLSKVLDSVLSWFYVINKYDNTMIPGVVIRVYKTIPGEGKVEVQSKETDATGSTTLSFITLDPYDLEFYYNRELIWTTNLVPNSPSFYVYLELETWTTTLPDVFDIDMTFYPEDNPIYPDDSNYLHFNFKPNCSSYGITGATINRINFEIYQWDTNFTPATHVYTNVVCDTNMLKPNDLLINMADLNGHFPLIATIWITHGGKTFTEKMSWFAESRNDWGLLKDLKLLKGDLLGDFGAAIIVVFLCIIIGAFLIKTTPLTTGAAGFIICGVIGFFAYIEWIDWTLFFAACLFSFGAFLLTMRGRD